MNAERKNGDLSELFCSIQGEGIYVGVMQIFLRLAGCSLGCCYCDTPAPQGEPSCCVIYDGESVEKISNPVSPERGSEAVAALARRHPGVHSLSITGGEPLEQPDFLISFLEIFRKEGIPVYLETNGLEEEAMRLVAPLTDIISLDIKLPSLCGGGDFFEIYKRVLPLLAGREFFCKIVVADLADKSEFAAAVRLLSSHDRSTRLVIQPATPVTGCRGADPALLLDCYRKASRELDDVRVIPQCHRIMGLR
ncbi:MAG: 7-carboxy-7-deazaguanine synthase QueE [Candidatus Krumholzibacteriota bacterium]|nr:7-carboxy-7-deazaguanine synthase QueE [Candidatus Krumholzibacteriota bacterium]